MQIGPALFGLVILIVGGRRFVRALRSPRRSGLAVLGNSLFALLGVGFLVGGLSGYSTIKAARRVDTSYAGLRGRSLGIDAEHRAAVYPEFFAGRFLWVDFAAPWCAPCLAQAQTIHELEQQPLSNVVFLTVMTSDGSPTDPAGPGTAREWARRFSLDRERVLAGDAWGRVVPTHLLFSPEGHSLFRHEGSLPAESVREVLARELGRWNRRSPGR